MDRLPADLIDRILTYLPDFDTLFSTILVSKSIYNVFKIRPSSIKAAVTDNVVGPCVKQAMALSNLQWSPSNDKVSIYNEDNAPSYPAHRQQGKQLLECARVVASFKNLFSRRFVAAMRETYFTI